MTRLTKRDEFGNADIIGVDSTDLQYNLEFDDLIKATEALNKLAKYEDLEEQRKLLKLPCAVGDTVYRINKGAKEPIIPMKVCEVGVISLKVGGFAIQIMCHDELDDGETRYFSTAFGKTVFSTKREAAQALERMEDRNEK